MTDIDKDKATQASKSLCPHLSQSDRLDWREGFMCGAVGREARNWHAYSPAAAGYKTGEWWRREQLQGEQP